jgi:hypothetical protein
MNKSINIGGPPWGDFDGDEDWDDDSPMGLIQ